MTAKFKTIGFSAAYIVVLLGMLFGLFFATKPIVEKKAMQGKIAMYSEVLTGIDTIEDVKKDTDPVTILDKHLAKNDKDEVIATLYRAFKTNQYASSTDTGIELLVSIDKDGKILGIKVTVDQSISPELTKKYVESFKGSNIQTPKSMDGVSRPSVAFSLATVDEILKDIATSQGIAEVEKTVYEVVFGDDYVLGAKEDVNEGVIKHVYPVTGSIKNGKVFYLEGSDHFNGPDSDVKPAGVRILVSNDNEFLGYDFDDEEVIYEHTKGFQKFVKEFLDGFVGQKLPEIADDIDTASGASFSKALVYDMILELSAYVKEA